MGAAKDWEEFDRKYQAHRKDWANRPRKMVTEFSGQSGIKQSQEYSKTFYRKLVKGPKYAKNRAYPTNTLVKQHSSIHVGDKGRQAFLGNEVFSFADVDTMISKLKLQSPDSFKPVGAGEQGAAEAGSAINVYLMSCEQKSTFTNWANVGVTIKIFEIHPKKATNTIPQIAISRGLEEGQGHDWIEDSTATNEYFNLPVDIKPTDSDMFKDNWGIDRYWSFHLKPGDTHEHRALYAINKMKGAHELQTTTNPGGDQTYRSYLPGVSRFFMFSMTGDPVYFAPTTGTPSVTTAPTQVGMVQHIKYKFSMHHPNVGDWDVIGNQIAGGPSAVGVTTTRQNDGDEVATDIIA